MLNSDKGMRSWGCARRGREDPKAHYPHRAAELKIPLEDVLSCSVSNRASKRLLGVFRAIFRSVGSPDHRNRVYSWGRKIPGISAWRSGGFFSGWPKRPWIRVTAVGTAPRWYIPWCGAFIFPKRALIFPTYPLANKLRFNWKYFNLSKIWFLYN